MPTGSIKFFDVQRGFGFITPDDGGPDVYVSTYALVVAKIDTLERRQRLSYELGPVTQRVVATKIRLLDEAKPEASETTALSDMPR